MRCNNKQMKCAVTETTAGGTEATSALKSPTLLSRAPTLRSPSGAPVVSLEARTGRGHLGLRREGRGGTRRKERERETATEAGAIAVLAWTGPAGRLEVGDGDRGSKRKSPSVTCVGPGPGPKRNQRPTVRSSLEAWTVPSEDMVMLDQAIPEKTYHAIRDRIPHPLLPYPAGEPSPPAAVRRPAGRQATPTSPYPCNKEPGGERCAGVQQVIFPLTGRPSSSSRSPWV
jgi:hypothetical protein